MASTPAGATVFIDGVRRGISPLVLELPIGEHVIIVERAGYQRFERKVKIADRATVLEAILMR